MAFRAICVALLLSSLPIAGCGTVANLASSRPEEGGKSPFGGVRQDVCCIEKAANGEVGSRTHPKSGSEPWPYTVAPMLFAAADLPFSLIGDVVTWPYTAAYSCINQPIPTPPVTQAPAQPPLQLPEPPAQEKRPAVKPEPEPTLPPPRRVEALVPQQGVLLLPVDSPAPADRGEPK